MMTHPINGPYITNPANGYGMRMHPIYHEMRMHDGQDFGSPSGTALVAVESGRVFKVGGSANNGAGGFYIFIKLDSGPVVGYQHMIASVASTLPLKTRVNQGDLIGRVGSTGASTSPHLHFTVNTTGKDWQGNTDPVSWLKSRGVYCNDINGNSTNPNTTKPSSSVTTTSVPVTSGSLPFLKLNTDGGIYGRKLFTFLCGLYSNPTTKLGKLAAKCDPATTWIGQDKWNLLDAFCKVESVGLLSKSETLTTWGPRCWAAVIKLGFKY